MSVLTTWAVVLGSLAAIVTAVKVITGSGPVRWLWTRLIHEPIEDRLRRVVQTEVRPMLEEALTELKPNGGSSLHDAVRRIEARLQAFEQNYESNQLKDR